MARNTFDQFDDVPEGPAQEAPAEVPTPEQAFGLRRRSATSENTFDAFDAKPRVDPTWGHTMSGLADVAADAVSLAPVGGMGQYINENEANNIRELLSDPRRIADAAGLREVYNMEGPAAAMTRAAPFIEQKVKQLQEAETARKNWERVRHRGEDHIYNATPDFSDDDWGKQYVWDLGLAGMKMAPVIATGMATRSPFLAAAAMGPGVFGEEFGRARDEGRSFDEATMDAAASTVIESGSEFIPLGFALRAGTPVLRRLLQTSVGEGGTEVASSILQTMYDAGVVDDNTTIAEALTKWDTYKQAGYEGLIGLGLGIGLGGGGAMTQGAAEQRLQRNIKQVTENFAFDQVDDATLEIMVEHGGRLAKEYKDAELQSSVDALRAERAMRRDAAAQAAMQRQPKDDARPAEELFGADPNAVVDTPTPEAPETIEAQLEAFTKGRKPAILVTPGEDLPELPEGAKSAEIPGRGTLYYRDDATLQAALDGRMGEALGYGIDEKPLASDQVVTARDDKGRVIQDVLTDGSPQVEAAAQGVAGPAGQVETRPLEDAMQERGDGIVPKVDLPTRTSDHPIFADAGTGDSPDLSKLRTLKGALLSQYAEMDDGQKALADQQLAQIYEIERRAGEGKVELSKEDKALIRQREMAERRKKAMQPDPEKDSLLTIIAKLGGISREEAEADGYDPEDIKKAKGFRIYRPFKRGGESFDGMAEQLRQYGYSFKGPQDLDRAIRAEMAGTLQFAAASNKTMEEQFEDAEALKYEGPEEEAGQAQPVDANEFAAMGGPEYYPEQDYTDSLFEDQEYEPDWDAPTRSLRDLHVEASAYDRAAADLLLESERPEHEIAADLLDIIKRGEANEQQRAGTEEQGPAGTEQPGGSDTRGIGAPAEGPQEGAGGPGQGARAEAAPTQGLTLTPQTPEDIEAQNQAEKARQAEEAAADAKAKADAELGGFTLTGSDSAVDKAEAQGQTNLFDIDAKQGSEDADREARLNAVAGRYKAMSEKAREAGLDDDAKFHEETAKRYRLMARASKTRSENLDDIEMIVGKLERSLAIKIGGREPVAFRARTFEEMVDFLDDMEFLPEGIDDIKATLLDRYNERRRRLAELGYSMEDVHTSPDTRDPVANEVKRGDSELATLEMLAKANKSVVKGYKTADPARVRFETEKLRKELGLPYENVSWSREIPTEEGRKLREKAFKEKRKADGRGTGNRDGGHTVDMLIDDTIDRAEEAGTVIETRFVDDGPTDVHINVPADEIAKQEGADQDEAAPSKQREDKARRVKVSPGGMDGTITVNDWVEARGPWASSTGYKSFAGKLIDDLVPGNGSADEKAAQLAQGMHDEAAALPWLVWKEHKDNGWKDIDTDVSSGALRIRVPEWHDGRIVEVLQEAGFAQTNRDHELNSSWVLPKAKSAKIGKSKLRKALKPILADGTRLADQGELAAQLRTSFVENKLIASAATKKGAEQVAGQSRNIPEDAAVPRAGRKDAPKYTPMGEAAKPGKPGKAGEAGSYGKKNKVFTQSDAEKARELLRKKLGQLNSGLDPELVKAGMTLAGYHIEAGARKFADFTKAMIEDLGDAVRPYLRSWYESIRHYPGFDTEGMTPAAEIDAAEADAKAEVEERDLMDDEEIPHYTNVGKEHSFGTEHASDFARYLEIEQIARDLQGDSWVEDEILELLYNMREDSSAAADYRQEMERLRADPAARAGYPILQLYPHFYGEVAEGLIKGTALDDQDRKDAYYSERIVDIQPLYEYLPEHDSIFNLRNGEMAELLRSFVRSNAGSYRQAMLDNESIQDLLDSEEYGEVWEKIVNGDNPVVQVEFEHTIVWGSVGEAISYKFGMSGVGGPEKTAWGKLLRIAPLPADIEMHPTRLVYFPKDSNAIKMRQITRNELKVALGSEGARIVNGLTHRHLDQVALEQDPAYRATIDDGVRWGDLSEEDQLRLTRKYSKKGKGPYLKRLAQVEAGLAKAEQRTVRAAKGAGHVNTTLKDAVMKGDADLIIEKTRLSPQAFFDAVKTGNLEHIAQLVEPSAKRRAAAKTRFMLDDAAITPASAQQKLQQMQAAKLEWDKYLAENQLGVDQEADLFGGLANAITEESENAPDTGTSETGRSSAGAEPAIESPARDEQSETDRGDELPGREAGEGGVSQQGDTGVSGAGAASPGEPGIPDLFAGEREPRLDGAAAGPAGRGGAPGAGEAGVRPESRATGEPGAAADRAKPSLSAKRKLQDAANKLPVTLADPQNIRDTVPYLLDEQRGDVLKAEARFENSHLPGILFTNGTGTGKTYSGLGIAARHIRATGDDNVLILAPTDPKVKDWIEDAENLGIHATQLKDKKDVGKGVVVTTYANFRDNWELQAREFSLVIPDESHYLKESATSDNLSLNAFRAIANHPDGLYHKAMMRDPEAKELEYGRRQFVRKFIGEKIAEAKKEAGEGFEATDVQKEAWKKLANKEYRTLNGKAYEAAQERARESAEQLAETHPLGRTRAVFLSASPFAYHFSLDYGDGFLFEYGDYKNPKPEGSRGYNEGTERDQFFMRHFGYRMRTNRLTQPDKDVDMNIMERQFHEWLREQGAVSGRMLEVDYDYSRDFVLFDSELGRKIDEGINILNNRTEDGEHLNKQQALDIERPYFRLIPDLLRRKYNYVYMRQLMEAIKADGLVERVQQHLALGRKVVVFHDFQEFNGRHPFDLSDLPVPKMPDDAMQIAAMVQLEAEVEAFYDYRPDLRALPLTGLRSVVRTMEKAFGERVAFISGQVSKADKMAAKRSFNEDDSGIDVIVVQRKSGREGLSLHDVTGARQRVLIDMGLPVAPVDALQTEGRVYRWGVMSDAAIEYPVLGTGFEQTMYATKIANRSRTVENLAMGNMARNLESAFKDGYLGAYTFAPSKDQGKGGKERDRAYNALSPWDVAKTLYFGRGKNAKRRDQREGFDYFSTPEPLGLKMVEWADIRPAERALEPSAGHGAIARWFPENARNVFVEPSNKLANEVMLLSHGEAVVSDFESLPEGSKFDAVVMNPPFGQGGALAIPHLQKAMRHLKNGGRIVALLPTGPAADKRFDALMYGNAREIEDLRKKANAGLISGSEYSKRKRELEAFQLTQSIKLPRVVFERAGTTAATRIVVIDRYDNPDMAPMQHQEMDLGRFEDINEFFDAIEYIDVEGRNDIKIRLPSWVKPGERAEVVLNDGKELSGAVVETKGGAMVLELGGTTDKDIDLGDERIVEIRRPVDWRPVWLTPDDQEYKSTDASINRTENPVTIGLVEKHFGGWESGKINADLGGGMHDNTIKYLAEQGVENVVYDPFNRAPEYNERSLERIRNGQADTVTINNTLNVIKEADIRNQLLREAQNALKPGGSVYIQIYEGDGTGNGRHTKGDIWQENRKAKDYLEEVRKVFPDAEIKHGLITAKATIVATKSAAGAWETWEAEHTKTGETVYMAKVRGRLDRAVYTHVAAVAKTNGGYWSRFGKPGFLFKSAGDRAAFMADIEENNERMGGPLGVSDEKGLYSGYEREAGNLQIRERRGRKQITEQHAFDLEHAAPVPAEKAGAVNFLTRYKPVETGQVRAAFEVVETPEQAAHVLAQFRKSAQETMMALVLDKDNKVLTVVRHSIGTIDGASVYPGVLAGAIIGVDGASSVYLAHNHPSGISEPSMQDYAITEKIHEAMDGTGIEIAGHLVLGAGRKASFFGAGPKSGGSRDIEIAAGVRKLAHPITERVMRKAPPSMRQAISSPDSARRVVEEDIQAKNALVLLDNRHRIVGTLAMSHQEMQALRENGNARRVLSAITETNAAAAIIRAESRGAAANIAKFLNAGKKVRTLDAFYPTAGDSGLTSSASMGHGTEDLFGPFLAVSRAAAESSDGPAPLAPDAVEAIIKRLSTDMGIEGLVVTHRSMDTLPPEIQEEADRQSAPGVKGAFYEGKIHIVTSNMESEAEIEEILLHEAYGHYGFATLFGKLGTRAANALLTKIGGIRGVRQIAKKAGIEEELQPYLDALKHQPPELRARLVVEELLALLQGEQAYKGLPERAKRAIMEWWGAVRQWLRDKGFAALPKYTDADLALLLKNMRTAAQSGGGKTTTPMLVVGQARSDQMRSSSADAMPLFSFGKRYDRRSPTPGERQGNKLVKMLADGQYIDRSYRAAFDLMLLPVAKRDKRRNAFEARGGVKAVGRQIGAVTDAAIRHTPWMSQVIETAKAGLVDRYGVPPELIDREYEMEAEERQLAHEAIDFIKAIDERMEGLEDARTMQAILNGERPTTEQWEGLSSEIREAIDKMGARARDLGLISAEQYERHKGSYLHRVYAKYEAPDKLNVVARRLRSKRRRIIGDTLRGRGMSFQVAQERLQKNLPPDWWPTRMETGAADKRLKGAKFMVFDRLSHTGEGTQTAPGIEEGGRKAKVLERVYWPSDVPVPAKYQAWANRGEWEVVGTKGSKLILWRDYTKAERNAMGEILDARYTIARTYQKLARDLSTASFFKDIAENQEWTWHEDGEPPNAINGVDGTYRAYGTYDWVLVPTTEIPNTGGKKRWGDLAGRYIQAGIWRDLNELQKMHTPGFWRQILTQWKLNKTARSPVVHMNNVMSNFLLADLADVRMRDLVRALHAMHNKATDQDYKDAAIHGAFGSTFIQAEIQREILDPILEELGKKELGKKGWLESAVPERLALMGKIADMMYSGWKKFDDKATGYYQLEDEWFRMATYLRQLELGLPPAQAARVARDQFLNYDIRAPWINAMRYSVMPFISYTYRAVPVIARSVVERPWKVAKYVSMAWLAEQMAYALTGGDEDEERRSMREEVQGRTWLGFHRMLRMPFDDAWGNPYFLDIRRWVPAGDVFDTGQNPLGIPAPLHFSGPLMLAVEMALNKSAFTNDEIWSELADTKGQQLAKAADHLWKSWMPSAPWVPGSWYYDKIKRAVFDGARDRMGRPYATGAALLSSVGIKLAPHDVQLGLSDWAWRYNTTRRALMARAKLLSRDYMRGIISEDAYKDGIATLQEQLRELQRNQAETFGGE